MSGEQAATAPFQRDNPEKAIHRGAGGSRSDPGAQTPRGITSKTR